MATISDLLEDGMAGESRIRLMDLLVWEKQRSYNACMPLTIHITCINEAHLVTPSSHQRSPSGLL